MSDATRRAVVAHLTRGPASVSELAGPHDIALPSFMKHLGVLEKAGIVTSTKQGRVRTCQIDLAALRQAEHWLAVQRQHWEGRLDRLSALAEQIEAEGKG